MLVSAVIKRTTRVRQPGGTQKDVESVIANVTGDFQQLSARTRFTRMTASDIALYSLYVTNSLANTAAKDIVTVAGEGTFTVDNVEKRGTSFKVIMIKVKETV